MTGQAVANQLSKISDTAHVSRLWKLSRRSAAVAQLINLNFATRDISKDEVSNLVEIIYKSGLTELQARTKAAYLLSNSA